MNDIGIVLTRLVHGKLETDYGDFDIHVFHDGHEEAIVLSYGDFDSSRDVICRIHSECICSHAFFSKECDCREQMEVSQKLIIECGGGLIIYLRQDGKGNGIAAHVATLPLKRKGFPQDRSYEMVGFKEDSRHYDMAVKILKFFGVKSINLITCNKQKVEELQSKGIKVTNQFHLSNPIWLGKQRDIFVDNILHKESEPPLVREGQRRVFVIGELNIDIWIKDLEKRVYKGRVGGTGFNAAKALKQEGFEPIIFGKIGEDPDGVLIRDALVKEGIISLLGTTSKKQTGIAYIHRRNDMPPDGPKESANDYDLYNLNQAIVLANLDNKDLILLDGYIVDRLGVEYAHKLIKKIEPIKASLVFDLVPHLLYERFDLNEIKPLISGKVKLLIGEYRTLMGFLGKDFINARPSTKEVKKIFKEFGTKILIVRYGIENISSQEIWKLENNDTLVKCGEIPDTGYTIIPPRERSGFGDTLTAQALKSLEQEL